MRKKIPIIGYHSVPKTTQGDESCTALAGIKTSKTLFYEHMSYVSRTYSTVTLSEFMEYREGARALPPKPCVLTFDDVEGSVGLKLLALRNECVGLPLCVGTDGELV